MWILPLAFCWEEFEVKYMIYGHSLREGGTVHGFDSGFACILTRSLVTPSSATSLWVSVLVAGWLFLITCPSEVMSQWKRHFGQHQYWQLGKHFSGRECLPLIWPLWQQHSPRSPVGRTTCGFFQWPWLRAFSCITLPAPSPPTTVKGLARLPTKGSKVSADHLEMGPRCRQEAGMSSGRRAGEQGLFSLRGYF